MIPMIAAERCPSGVKAPAEELIQPGEICNTRPFRADLLCRPFGAGEVMPRGFAPFAEALPWPVMPRRFQERFRPAATHCAGSLMLPLLQDSSRADWWNRSSAVSHKFAARVCKEQPQVFRLRLAGKRPNSAQDDNASQMQTLGDGGQLERRRRQSRCDGTATEGVATEGVATEGTVTEGRAPRARTLIRTLRG
jgi:hypothetical protein